MAHVADTFFVKPVGSTTLEFGPGDGGGWVDSTTRFAASVSIQGNSQAFVNAGQTNVVAVLSVPAGTDISQFNIAKAEVLLDDNGVLSAPLPIIFTSNVPEPAALLLMTLASGLIVLRR